MKGKPNLSGAGIKQFFLEHGEKLGLGVAVLCLAFFAYSAMGQGDLSPSEEPDSVKQVAITARGVIEKGGKVPPPPPIIDSTKALELAKIPVAVEYNHFDQPVFPPQKKRPDLKMFPVEELVVRGGRAPLAVTPDPMDMAFEGAAPMSAPTKKPSRTRRSTARGASGGYPGSGYPGTESSEETYLTETTIEADPQIPAEVDIGLTASGAKAVGRHYALITGLVPVGRQRSEFLNRLQDTVKPDVQNPYEQEPQYGRFWIERAEVRNVNDDPEKLQWKEVDLRAALIDERQWMTGSEQSDLVDPAYKHPTLTRPLPPLLGKVWAENASHPKIPLTAMGMEGSTPGQEGMLEEFDPLQQLELGAGGMGSGYEGSGSSYRGGGMPSSGSGYSGGGGSGGYGEGYSTQQLIPNLLFRFTDFTVQPGKKYRYRVKVNVGNPNYGIAAQYLMNPESFKLQVVETPWSDPTPVVAIPRDHQALALGATPPRYPTDEVRGKMGVVSWYDDWEQTGPVEATGEVDLAMGDTANTTKKTVQVIDYVQRTLRELENFQFRPNLLLADVRVEGDPQQKQADPSAMLLLDAQGNLHVHRVAVQSPRFGEIQKSVNVAEELMPAPVDAEGGLFGSGEMGYESSEGPLRGRGAPRRGRSSSSSSGP